MGSDTKYNQHATPLIQTVVYSVGASPSVQYAAVQRFPEYTAVCPAVYTVPATQATTPTHVPEIVLEVGWVLVVAGAVLVVVPNAGAEVDDPASTEDDDANAVDDDANAVDDDARVVDDRADVELEGAGVVLPTGHVEARTAVIQAVLAPGYSQDMTPAFHC